MAAQEPLSETGQAPDRIPLEEVYMRMAEELAKRSTCARLQVGSVITTGDLTQLLGIGYNGNAPGLPNRCDSDQPGNCGCLHSEQNALIKSGAQLPGKLMSVSASPCVMCAQMIRNPNVPRGQGGCARRAAGGAGKTAPRRAGLRAQASPAPSAVPGGRRRAAGQSSAERTQTIFPGRSARAVLRGPGPPRNGRSRARARSR